MKKTNKTRLRSVLVFHSIATGRSSLNASYCKRFRKASFVIFASRNSDCTHLLLTTKDATFWTSKPSKKGDCRFVQRAGWRKA
jgi:hypothetical protein